ncbi:uncharacterized protein LOC128930265 isoform X2 [Callithrix jacchus]
MALEVLAKHFRLGHPPAAYEHAHFPTLRETSDTKQLKNFVHLKFGIPLTQSLICLGGRPVKVSSEELLGKWTRITAAHSLTPPTFCRVAHLCFRRKSTGAVVSML